MSIAHDQLPDNVDALKDLVLERSTQLADVSAQNDRLTSQVTILQEQLNIALAKRFASRTTAWMQEVE